MKSVFSLIGLLLVLAVIGVLVKKQLAPRLSTTPVSAAATPASGTARQQAQQIQQDVKKAVEGAMQPARPVPDDSQ